MLDSLYKNIGSKIKKLAKWIFIVEAIGSIITGIILATEEDILYIFIAIGGSIVAWVSSWILYAFGELVEDIHQIKIQNSRIYNIDKNIQLIAQPKIVEAEEKAEREAEEKAKNEVKKQAVTDAVKKYDAEKKQLAQKIDKTLADKLAYALLFQTDEGMIKYLKDIPDESVQNILTLPKQTIRKQLENLLKSM